MKRLIPLIIVFTILFFASTAMADPVLKQIYYQKTTSLYYPKKYTFKFSLWDNPDPGSGTMVWSEEKQITLTTNKIKTYLGDTTALDNVDFSQQLYVQVERKKADGTYVVVGVRDRLTIVPYAFSFQTPLTLTDYTTMQPLLRITNTYGPAIMGESTGGGRGVFGSSNTGRGVYGYSESDVGVYGVGNAGSAYGVYGIHNGTGYHGFLGGDFYGAFGHGYVGVHGENADGSIYGKLGTLVAGVHGHGTGAAYSGYFEGGAGVYIEGNLNVTGAKNFTTPS